MRWTAVGAVTALFGCLTALAPTPASGAIGATNVTVSSPTGTYLIADLVSGANTITLSGTAEGSAGERLDINCYAGNQVTHLVQNVELQKGGAFAYSGPLAPIAGETCVLRAVPHGDTTPYPPNTPSRFHGPLLAVGERYSDTVESGPNVGKLYSHYLFAPGLLGGFAYGSLGECALETAELYDPLSYAPQPLFGCSAFLWWENGQEKPGFAKPTRSELQVDSQNAYLPANVVQLFSGAAELPGFPATSYRFSENPENGVMILEEAAETVFCAPANTFPPTAEGCKELKPTGVRLYLKVVQEGMGREAKVVQYLEATDGRPHEVDLLEDNQFAAPTREGELWFPWLGGGFAVYPTPGQQLGPPPGAPATLYLRAGAAEGPLGAITFAAPPEGEAVVGATNGPAELGWFELHYRRVVPASGSLALGFTYNDGFTLAEVEGAAKGAAASYQPTVTVAGPTKTTTASTTVGGTVTSAYGIASLAVQGRAVSVAQNGTYSASVTLQPGQNVITAVATNPFGNAATAATTITYLPPPPPGLVLAGKPFPASRGVGIRVRCDEAKGKRCRGLLSLRLAGRGGPLGRRRILLAGGRQALYRIPLSKRARMVLRRRHLLVLTVDLESSLPARAETATVTLRGLSARELAALVRRHLRHKGLRARVRCPSLLPLHPGAHVRCSARLRRRTVVAVAVRVGKGERLQLRLLRHRGR